MVSNTPANWQNKYVIVSGASAGSFLQQNSTTRISPKEFIAVEAGKRYTISLKELTNVDYYFKVTMSTVNDYGVANSMLNEDEWIHSDSYTFTAPEGCKYVMVSVGCDAGVVPDDLNSKFRIKLEEGTSATFCEGGRNLYILSQNDPSHLSRNQISDFNQNISTGEISFKVTGRDPYFGAQANKNEAIGTYRGVKIPVNGQDIAVKLTNTLFTKNFVSFWNAEGKATKNFQGGFQSNEFIVKASDLEGVSYVTFRFGIKEETQEVGSVHSTKIKVEYGNIHTDWSPAPEDLGWSMTTLVPTQQQRYLWKFEYIYYSDGSVEITQPVNLSIAGADADTTGVTAAISEIDSKANSLRADLTNVSNSLSNAASQLQAQAAAQADLTSRVSTVEETTNGTKTTVTELAKTVDDNTDDITSITQRTTAIETDLSGTKATLSQIQTTANTTTANLATYQASNDQAVANLQSSLQTTNGNVSSLQTQINAVPGQITSAVSAVEGKIPTEIGGRNLYALSKNSPIWSNNITSFAQNIATGEISFKVAGSDPYFGVQANKDEGVGTIRGIKVPVKIGQSIAVQLTNELFAKNFVSYFGDDDKAVKVFKGYQSNKFTVPASELEGVSYVTFRFGIKEETQEIGSVHTTKIKVEYGSVYTDWSPAPEDTASNISNLSSQIQQTADGMTLLATKTELNSAKSELQSGITTATSKADSAQATANSNAQTISTHTTQISALNTGLQAKVSQSDFDSLSGDVDDLSSELTQTASSITASVSSVETKADNAQTTANSAVSKANAAQTAVNTLDSEVVKSASLNLDNNGFVTKVGKTVDGNKFATMIAQDANNVKIIADEMQVTANMIVDGAVTANKLNVNNLSAVNSNLGAIKGGSLLLQENKSAGSATDSWGTYNRPAYKQGLFLDNHAFASSGAIQRKNGNETTPTDMPLAVLQAGELRFLVVDYNDNLENVVHYGLSDPDFGAIRFEIDSELKRRLTMTSSGYLNFQASNYTDWIPLSQQGCEYMIQGRLVVVNYDVTYSQGGTHKIGDIPQEFVKKELMLTAKAWSITPNDKNFQLNADGGLHLLNADANVTYRGTLLFSY